MTVVALLLTTTPGTFGAEDLTQYIDPRIGNVSMLLVPTYPTFSRPNQMLRMVPAKENYIEDQVSGFPLQVGGHRMAGIVPLKVALGPLAAETWKRKMTIDHDLEVVRPWHYSTYLVDDDIRVSFTPAKRAAIYQIEFPVTTAGRNLLFSGSANLKSSSPGASAFALEEQFSIDNKGLQKITRTQTVYGYGEITDTEGRPIAGLRFDPAPRGFSFTLPADAPATVLIKYGISYISPEQARKNYQAEAATAKFADLVTQGHAAWAKVTGQLVVEGGTEAQKRSFSTAFYRIHERMVDVNEGGQYYSGYDQKVHQSDRPFYVDDWIWDTYLATHPLRTLIDPALQSDILNLISRNARPSPSRSVSPMMRGPWRNSPRTSAGRRISKPLRGSPDSTAISGTPKSASSCPRMTRANGS